MYKKGDRVVLIQHCKVFGTSDACGLEIGDKGIVVGDIQKHNEKGKVLEYCVVDFSSNSLEFRTWNIPLYSLIHEVPPEPFEGELEFYV